MSGRTRPRPRRARSASSEGSETCEPVAKRVRHIQSSDEESRPAETDGLLDGYEDTVMLNNDVNPPADVLAPQGPKFVTLITNDAGEEIVEVSDEQLSTTQPPSPDGYMPTVGLLEYIQERCSNHTLVPYNNSTPGSLPTVKKRAAMVAIPTVRTVPITYLRHPIGDTPSMVDGYFNLPINVLENKYTAGLISGYPDLGVAPTHGDLTKVALVLSESYQDSVAEGKFRDRKEQVTGPSQNLPYDKPFHRRDWVLPPIAFRKGGSGKTTRVATRKEQSTEWAAHKKKIVDQQQGQDDSDMLHVPNLEGIAEDTTVAFTQPRDVETTTEPLGISRRDRPPMLGRQLARSLNTLFKVYGLTIRQHAAAKFRTIATIDPSARLIMDKIQDWHEDMVLEWALEALGGAAVTTTDKGLRWAVCEAEGDWDESFLTFLSSSHGLDQLAEHGRYQKAIRGGCMKLWRTVRLQEDRRFKSVRAIDTKCLKDRLPIVHQLSNGVNFEQPDAVKHKADFDDTLSEYAKRGAPPLAWVFESSGHLAERAALHPWNSWRLDFLHHADDNTFQPSLLEDEWHALLFGHVDEDQIIDDYEEVCQTFTTHNTPGHYGDGTFAKWDPYKHLLYLGVTTCLDVDQRKHYAAVAVDYYKRRDESGEVEYPSELLDIGIPNINFLDPSTGEKIRFKPHQLAAACAILHRGYRQKQWTTMLCDEVGLGKTWVVALIIAITVFHRLMSEKYPRPSEGSAHFHAPVIGRSTQWIGEERRQRYKHDVDDRRRHVFISNNSIIRPQMAEIRRLLHNRFFHLVDLTSLPLHAAEDLRTAHVFSPPSAVLIPDFEVIFFTTQSTVAAQSRRLPPGCLSETCRPNTLFFKGLLLDNLFVDELGQYRDPVTNKSISVRRLVEQSCVTIGATGTPVESTMADLFVMARNLGMPHILNRRAYGAATDIDFIEYDNASQHSLDKMLSLANIREFADCHEQVRLLMMRNSVLVWRRFRLRKRNARGIDMSSTVEQDIWHHQNPSPMPDWSHKAFKNPKIQEAVREYKQKLLEYVVCPTLDLFEGHIIRRSHSSLGFDNKPLTDLKRPEIVPHYIDLDSSTADWYHEQEGLVPPEAANFAVHTRRLLRVGRTSTENGFYRPNGECSPIIDDVAERILEMNDSNDALPENNKQKAVLFITFVSALSFMLADLADKGVFAMVLTGEHSAEERQAKLAAFNRDEDHLSEPLVVVQGDDSLVEYPSVPCRVIIVSSVASHGIWLGKASLAFILDLPWSRDKVEQMVGRLARIGQREQVNTTVYVVKGTIDDRIHDIIQAKGEVSDLFAMASARPDSWSEAEDDELDGIDAVKIKEVDDKLRRRGVHDLEDDSEDSDSDDSDEEKKDYVARRLRLRRQRQRAALRSKLVKVNTPVLRKAPYHGPVIVDPPEEFTYYSTLQKTQLIEQHDRNLSHADKLLVLQQLRPFAWLDSGKLTIENAIVQGKWDRVDQFISAHRTGLLLRRLEEPDQDQYGETMFRFLYSILNCETPVVRGILPEFLASVINDNGFVHLDGLNTFPGSLAYALVAPKTLGRIEEHMLLPLSPDPTPWPWTNPASSAAPMLSDLVTRVGTFSLQAKNHFGTAHQFDSDAATTKQMDSIRRLTRRVVADLVTGDTGDDSLFATATRLLAAIDVDPHLNLDFFPPRLLHAQIDGAGEIADDIDVAALFAELRPNVVQASRRFRSRNTVKIEDGSTTDNLEAHDVRCRTESPWPDDYPFTESAATSSSGTQDAEVGNSLRRSSRLKQKRDWSHAKLRARLDRAIAVDSDDESDSDEDGEGGDLTSDDEM